MNRSNGLLADTIRENRRYLAYTQLQLADKAGVSLRAISLLEAGDVTDPHLSTLINLADALGITVATLIGETE